MGLKNQPNCWDVMDCKDKENCPAYPMYGRLCFSVKGTLCKGEVQGDYSEKIARCRSGCEFYKSIIEES